MNTNLPSVNRFNCNVCHNHKKIYVRILFKNTLQWVCLKYFKTLEE